MHTADSALNLKVGEWVEVRTASEILATLDEHQNVDNLPFMREMLKYCGKRFRVFKSSHKTADTIELFSIRRMERTVHLENLRCDGTEHGGCMAACLLYWKECWLKRTPASDASSEPPSQTQAETNPAWQVVEQGARSEVAPITPPKYRCQATEMVVATHPVRRRQRWDPRFYIRDLTSGNVTLVNFVRYGLFAMVNAFLKQWFGFYLPCVRGLAGEKTPTQSLNLQPGELVRVKSKEDVMRTLNSQQRNRGMWFDAEMLPYCGKGNFRVLSRVDKLINEKTGEMVKMMNPCIILEGLTCSGNLLPQRMFSPRNEYMYFREIWLERVTIPQEVQQSISLKPSPALETAH